MRTIPSYARHMVSEPSLTLLPPPPKPPTPPSTRKRKTAPPFIPKWAVGARIAVRDFEKFAGMTTTVIVEKVITHTPRVYERTFDPIPLYVVRYRDNTVLIVNEGALSVMAGYALKQNARTTANGASVSTDTHAATDTTPTAA